MASDDLLTHGLGIGEVMEVLARGAAHGFPVNIKKEFGDQKVESLKYAAEFYLGHEKEWLAGAPDQVKKGSPQTKAEHKRDLWNQAMLMARRAYQQDTRNLTASGGDTSRGGTRSPTPANRDWTMLKYPPATDPLDSRTLTPTYFSTRSRKRTTRMRSEST